MLIHSEFEIEHEFSMNIVPNLAIPLNDPHFGTLEPRNIPSSTTSSFEDALETIMHII